MEFIFRKKALRKISTCSDNLPTINTVSKKGQWLNNFEIEYLLQKYNNNSFVFLGCFTIDFQENKLFKRFNIKKFPDQIGIILNTAKNGRPGKHWISIFISKIDKTICIFDSNGSKPKEQLIEFIKKINKKQEFSVYFNRKQLQKTDGTCGLFAINFIIERISGKTCDELSNSENMNDKIMECLRSKIFLKR